jgi:hypothetical protein
VGIIIFWHSNLSKSPAFFSFYGFIYTCYVSQAALEFLGSSDSPTSASQVALTVGTCNHVWPGFAFIIS